MTANSLSFWPSAAATVLTWHRFCAPCSGCGPSGSVGAPGVGVVGRRPGLGEGIDISSTTVLYCGYRFLPIGSYGRPSGRPWTSV